MRLLSYNIHKGVGGRDRRYLLDRVMEVIEGENPDVICLQEVVRKARHYRSDDQPRLLADRFLPEGWMFQLNVHYREGGYGNLLLSRWPITLQHQISLRLNSRKPRGAQLAAIETPEGRLGIINMHLGLIERERDWQIRHLLEHRLMGDFADLPLLVTGDYNDWRNCLENGCFMPAGWKQITHPPSKFRSFPAWLPLGSLDKAFYRGAVEVRAARIVRNKLAQQASDHLPLVIDFHLTANEQAETGDAG